MPSPRLRAVICGQRAFRRRAISYGLGLGRGCTFSCTFSVTNGYLCCKHEIWEFHLPIYHTLCAMLELEFFGR